MSWKRKKCFGLRSLDTFEGEGYNLTAGGDGFLGGIHTEEAKRKISEAGKGNQNSLGYKHSDEAKRKIGEAQKGENHPNFGKPRSVEIRRKISEACKGNQNALGAKRSAETRRKLSEAGKRDWAKRKLQEKGSYIMNELETQKRIVSNGI